MTTAKHFWQIASNDLPADGADVHLFCATLDLSAGSLAEFGRTLSDDERQRAEGFQRERDRRRFIARRGTLREILGDYLEVSPSKLEFSYGPLGKPEIAMPVQLEPIHFNVTHSASIALYAIAKHEVGVDVERIRTIQEAELIASHYFSARENAWLRSLPMEEHAEAFLKCWTRKEAYLKAVGSGLEESAKQIEIPLMPDEVTRWFDFPGQAEPVKQSLVHSFEPARDFVGAVAIRKESLMADVGCNWIANPAHLSSQLENRSNN